MKNLFKALALSLFIIMPLTSCDLFEKSGNIENYIGSYTLDAANERTYHYYWGSKKLTNEKDISDAPKRIIINNDKTVTFYDRDGNENTGRVKCLEKYCRFYLLPVSSSYKFNLRNNKDLYYSYESFHMSVEYDVTYRTISDTRQ